MARERGRLGHRPMEMGVGSGPWGAKNARGERERGLFGLAGCGWGRGVLGACQCGEKAKSGGETQCSTRIRDMPSPIASLAESSRRGGDSDSENGRFG
eukprot:3819834-Rhodomonas_salina.1